MTTVIVKEKEWLKEQIEKGMDSFLEMEYEYLVEMMRIHVTTDLCLRMQPQFEKSD